MAHVQAERNHKTGLICNQKQGASVDDGAEPLFDMADFLEQINFNHQLAQKLLSSFINTVPSMCKKIEECRQDISLLRGEVHSLKGACFGAVRLQGILFKLYDNIKACDSIDAELDEQIDQVLVVSRETVEYVESLIKEIK
jgi:HPt (histidine-containing phosphotransfer) domain-containing protein